jgi:hypothetical protein
VVDVRVSEKHEVDAGRLEGEAAEVKRLFLIATLMKPAINQEAGLPDFQ